MSIRVAPIRSSPGVIQSGSRLASVVRILELLPDPPICPEERLERIARLEPSSVLRSANHRTARTKLNDLRNRLNELVPEAQGEPLAQLETLVDRCGSHLGSGRGAILQEAGASG